MQHGSCKRNPAEGMIVRCRTRPSHPEQHPTQKCREASLLPGSSQAVKRHQTHPSDAGWNVEQESAGISSSFKLATPITVLDFKPAWPMSRPPPILTLLALLSSRTLSCLLTSVLRGGEGGLFDSFIPSSPQSASREISPKNWVAFLHERGISVASHNDSDYRNWNWN